MQLGPLDSAQVCPLIKTALGIGTDKLVTLVRITVLLRCPCTFEQRGKVIVAHTLLKKCKGTLFNQSIASSQLNSWDIDLVS